MIATYITCVNTVATPTPIDVFYPNDTNSTIMNKNVEQNIEKICSFLELRCPENFLFGGWFSRILFVLFLLFFLKEGVEICICPSKTYYRNQYENIGQWTVFVFQICSVFILYLPKWTLVLPNVVVGIVYLCKVKTSWKNIEKKGNENESFNYQLSSMDKYWFIGTAIFTCIIPEIFFSWWILIGTAAGYFFISILRFFSFVIFCLVRCCCWPASQNSLQKYFFDDKSKRRWKKANCIVQFFVVCIHLILVARIPFVESWTYVIASVLCAVSR